MTGLWFRLNSPRLRLLVRGKELKVVEKRSSELILGRQEEESELRDLVVELTSSAEGDEEVLFKLREGELVGKDLVELPPVEKGKSDPSLQPWRQLADREDKGFSWAHGRALLIIIFLTNVSWL